MPAVVKPSLVVKYVALPTLLEFKAYIHAALCGLDHLDVAQSPMTVTVLLRRGVPCGYHFCVQGPRLLRNSAIWSSSDNRVLLYGSTGARVGELHLTEAPELVTPLGAAA